MVQVHTQWNSLVPKPSLPPVFVLQKNLYAGLHRNYNTE